MSTQPFQGNQYFNGVQNTSSAPVQTISAGIISGSLVGVGAYNG